MKPDDDPTMMAAFEQARPALFGMAYRMLGSRVDAEDVVHDVFLRWAKTNRTGIRNPSAWLMTACTNRSIDMLRSFARTRTDYVGPWLPEPLLANLIDEPVELSFALETAFLILLERTSPKERAAFLMHDVFGYMHSEIAETLDVTEEASRKLASRARSSVNSGQSRNRLDAQHQKKLLAAFEEAVLTGDMTAFSTMLAEDIRLIADGGGKVSAVEKPIYGSEPILAFLKTARNWWQEYRWTIESIANRYCIVMRDASKVTAAIWLDSRDGENVSSVYIMRNPDKLHLMT